MVEYTLEQYGWQRFRNFVYRLVIDPKGKEQPVRVLYAHIGKPSDANDWWTSIYEEEGKDPIGKPVHYTAHELEVTLKQLKAGSI